MKVNKFLLLILQSVVQAIIISEDATKQLVALLKEFDDNPTYHLYYNEFQPSPQTFSWPYQLFIWSPIQQYGITMCCPMHNHTFSLSSWTSNLHLRQNNKNPRLIFCLFNNVILVQSYYKCPGGYPGGHEVLSTSEVIMNLLTTDQLYSFNYRKYSRTIYSFKLTDFIFEQLSHGNNFQQISEIICNLRFNQYNRLSSHYQQSVDFHCDKISAFPSSSKIEEIFLDVFQERKTFYESNGGFRPIDEKFCKEIMKVYIVLDERQRIVGWKLTKTCKQSEVDCVLEEIASKTGNSLKYIIVDNCCDVANMYRIHFPMVDIKLDVFHAVQRLTKCIPNKMSPETRNVCNDIGLIFRDKNDHNYIRAKPTPTKEVLLENINYFLQKHKKFLEKMPETKRVEFMHAIELSKKHIIKGCLSGIQPGHGTEHNERLHRYMNYNCLRGVSLLGPELLIAILTITFFSYNSRIDGQTNVSNSKVIPIAVTPKINRKRAPELWLNSNNQNPLRDVNPTGAIYGDNVNLDINKLMKKINSLKNSIDLLNISCQRRNFAAENLLSHKFQNHYYNQLDVTPDYKYHLDTLLRNCSAFGLSIADVPADGDCLFVSILRQLHAKFDAPSACASWKQNILDCGVRFINEKYDVLQLRKLFVTEMKNNSKYDPFLIDTDTDIESYLSLGVYSSNIGDFVADVCCNILSVPIIILLSSREMAIDTFFPDNQLNPEPLVIAYNVSVSHYCNTEVITQVPEARGSCKCTSKRGLKCCSATSKYSSRCPCIKGNTGCNTSCRCNDNCDNSKTSSKTPINGCRCGTSSNQLQSCCDLDGKRKTKCKCYREKTKCTSFCRCNNCHNSYGRLESANSKNVSQINCPTRAFKTYRKSRGSLYMASKDEKQSHGTWTSFETIALYCCIEAISFDGNDTNIEYVHEVYSIVAKQDGEKNVRLKTISQVQSKLSYMLRTS